ncbi:MAG TPA: glucose-fructose oxidoreductase [Armatimonadetes bacterium]|nr:glucose-fructose oxidoreductase [Armatimonadota bacterium]
MGKFLRVAIIGTGRKKERADRFGYAMAYSHADAYKQIPGVELVACADISADNGLAFAQHYGLPADMVFENYRAMLDDVKPDMVSICTWMHLHEEMTLAAIEAGVRAIHCEKPMASTFGGARRMHEAAQAAGVRLTFNHQRRYGEPYVMGKKLLDDGVIGELVRCESECGNIYDSGTHFIDMMSKFNNEVPGKWVLGQIDYRTENRVFGGHCENQQVVLFEYENGVFGLVMGGAGGAHPIGAQNKFIGTEGIIECGRDHGPAGALRFRRWGDADWTNVDTHGASIHGPGFIERAIADVIDCVREGRPCQLDSGNAMIATEIIFGAYESSRRRGRVDFPLLIDDNPLTDLVDSGAITVEGL